MRISHKKDILVREDGLVKEVGKTLSDVIDLIEKARKQNDLRKSHLLSVHVSIKEREKV